MTHDSHYQMVHKTGNTNNQKQHVIGYEYIHIVVESHQLTISHTAGVCRELRDQFIASHNGKYPWLARIFFCTLCVVEHHDVVSSGILTHEFQDRCPREWMQQASHTLEDATEAYMVEVIAKFHSQKQQLISFRFSTCLLLCQGKKVGYS